MSDKPSTEELILNARAGIEHSKREGEVMFNGLNAPSMSTDSGSNSPMRFVQ